MRRPWLALAVLLTLAAASVLLVPSARGPRPATSVVAAASPASTPAAVPVTVVAQPAAQLRADGLPHEVRIAPKLRRAPMRATPPVAPLASWIDEYRALASGGDADASFMLALALVRCAGVLPDDAAVQAQLTRLTPRPKAPSQAQGYDALLSMFIASNRESSVYCADVPKPTMQEGWDFLEQAVQLGSLEAVPSYLWTPPHLTSGVSLGIFGRSSPGEPTEAERRRQAGIAQRQWQLALEAQARGSEQATFWLATQAHIGVDRTGANDETTRDPVAAYAGFLAYKMLRAATSRGLDHGTEKAIAEYERSLRPDQVDEAVTRALRIVGAPECCLVSDP